MFCKTAAAQQDDNSNAAQIKLARMEFASITRFARPKPALPGITSAATGLMAVAVRLTARYAPSSKTYLMCTTSCTSYASNATATFVLVQFLQHQGRFGAKLRHGKQNLPRWCLRIIRRADGAAKRATAQANQSRNFNQVAQIKQLLISSSCSSSPGKKQLARWGDGDGVWDVFLALRIEKLYNKERWIIDFADYCKFESVKSIKFDNYSTL